MLPIYVLPSIEKTPNEDTAPTDMLRFAWGKPIDPQSPRFFIAIDDDHLQFTARFSVQAVFDSSVAVGSFFEGLWNQDVIELFLIDDGGKAYQEINLSPSGAWWTARFSSYRQRSSPLPPPSAMINRCVTPSHLWVSLRLRRSDLFVQIDFTEASRANVSAMHHGTALSWATISSAQPDFHRTDEFEQLCRQPIT